jgi:transposase
VEEAASMLGKSSYTVREWCRHGQVNAAKRAERRGGAALWSISAEEVKRYKNEGLLAIDPDRNNRN